MGVTRQDNSGVLRNVGNVTAPPHVMWYVRQLDCVYSTQPAAILKVYNLHREDSASPTLEETVQAGEFAIGKINAGMIAPRSGIGFIMHSPGVLNVCLWGDGEYSDVLFPALYEGTVGNFNRVAFDQVGALCSKEAWIYQHELGLWTSYLRSRQTVKDKRAYFRSRLHGQILD